GTRSRRERRRHDRTDQPPGAADDPWAPGAAPPGPPPRRPAAGDRRSLGRRRPPPPPAAGTAGGHRTARDRRIRRPGARGPALPPGHQQPGHRDDAPEARAQALTDRDTGVLLIRDAGSIID